MQKGTVILTIPIKKLFLKHFPVLALLLFFSTFFFTGTVKALTPEDLDSYTGAKYEPVTGCYLGAYVDQSYWLEEDPGAFNEKTGKQHASFFRYVGYGKPFPSAWVQELAAIGAVAQIAWEPNEGLQQVRDNEYLREFARQAGKTGAPVFLRFASEANGDWTAYSEDPQKYIEKWKLVYNVMQEEAPNVALVWTVFTYPEESILDFYPGDDYVDWVGLNLYCVQYENANPWTPARTRDPLELLSFIYKNFGKRKPIHISEWAVVNSTVADEKDYTAFACDTISRMYHGIKEVYPRVKAVYYFDTNLLETAPPGRQIRDYSVSRKKETLEYYRQAIDNDFYLSTIHDNVNLPLIINGETLALKHKPINEKIDKGNDGENEIYVSAVDLAAALEKPLTWLGEGKISLGRWELFIDQPYLLDNGKLIATQKSPLLHQSRTYLPLKDFSGPLGYTFAGQN